MKLHTLFTEDAIARRTAYGLSVMGLATLAMTATAPFIVWRYFTGMWFNKRKMSEHIWRINIGVALILALNYLSLWLEPQCGPGGVLEKLCGR